MLYSGTKKQILIFTSWYLHLSIWVVVCNLFIFSILFVYNYTLV
ncbi:hypothetical protein QW060_27100 [Myroides ceti]|uniref:NADH dehydrogenase subunit 2 n=1 Tax=Paenimyroides ceti TaxID=395087 RepID=A0ABT8D0U3_9FLAO|nr:hypothetical protein [Paenimyroides ceti]MDN3710478.1 hypothetical protein [Paenimyroides ceti]